MGGRPGYAEDEADSDAGIRGAIDTFTLHHRTGRFPVYGNAVYAGGIAGTLRRADGGSCIASQRISVMRPFVIPSNPLSRRTFIISKTPPAGVRFSHPHTEPTHDSAPVSNDTALEDLFREPDFAPGTLEHDAGEPAPASQHHVSATNRRATGSRDSAQGRSRRRSA